MADDMTPAVATIDEFTSMLTRLPLDSEPGGREARTKVALAILTSGLDTSIREAADLCGIPYHYLLLQHRVLKQAKPPAGGREELIRASEKEIEELAVAGTVEAMRKMVEKIGEEDISLRDLTASMKAMKDTVAERFDWSNKDSGDDETKNALVGALEALRSGKKVQLTEPDAVEEATEIEAELVDQSTK